MQEKIDHLQIQYVKDKNLSRLRAKIAADRTSSVTLLVSYNW
jgi:hypothetical protein